MLECANETNGSTWAARAAFIHSSSAAVWPGLVRESHATARRANWIPLSWKRGSLNMSGFWSAMPIVSALAGAATARAASSTTSETAMRGMRCGYLLPVRSLLLDEDGVLVRVGRRAAAQQDERLIAGVEQLMDLARRDDDAVARRHFALL